MTPAELQAIRERATSIPRCNSSCQCQACEVNALLRKAAEDGTFSLPIRYLFRQLHEVENELARLRADRAALLAFVDKLEAGILSAEESRMLARRRRLERHQGTE